MVIQYEVIADIKVESVCVCVVTVNQIHKIHGNNFLSNRKNKKNISSLLKLIYLCDFLSIRNKNCEAGSGVRKRHNKKGNNFLGCMSCVYFVICFFVVDIFGFKLLGGLIIRLFTLLILE